MYPANCQKDGAGYSGRYDQGLDWHFTVTLSDASINGAHGDMTFVDGVAQFTLKHVETKTSTGLPAAISYSATQQEANLHGYANTQSGAEGTIPESGTASAEFINEKPAPMPAPTSRSTTTPCQTPGITSMRFGSTGTPSTTSKTNEPDTADHSNLALWLGLMLVSLAGIVIVCIVLMKKSKRDK